MKMFEEVHDIYNKYMLNKMFTLNEFVITYNSLDDYNKQMMDFIISKQEFYDSFHNKLKIENMYEFWESMVSDNENKKIYSTVHYSAEKDEYSNSLNLSQKNVESIKWYDLPYNVSNNSWRQVGNVKNLENDVKRPNSIKLRVNIVDINEADDIWDRVYPILKEYEDNIVYKVPIDENVFININSNPVQRGKFLTIYTKDNEQAFEIAKKLDKALENINATSYSSGTDIAIGNSGLVSATIDRDENGNYISDISGDRKKSFIKNQDFFKKNGLVYGLSLQQNKEKAASLEIYEVTEADYNYLQSAIKTNDIKGISMFLNNKKIDLNDLNKTIISDIMSFSNKETVDCLIDFGFDENTLLLNSCIYNREDLKRNIILNHERTDIVQVINDLKPYYPEESKNLANLSFSLLAVKNNVYKMESIRQASNIDINYSNGIAIRNAAGNNNKESIDYLISLGADKNLALLNALKYDHDITAAELIVQHKDIDIFKVLSSLEAISSDKLNKSINLCFASLAVTNDIYQMESLRLERSVDINYGDNLAIRNAAANNQYEAVNYLINLGASKESALQNSLKYNNFELSKIY